MKKVLFIVLAALMLANCGTVMPTARQTLVSFSDYRQYTQEGFLINPCPYTYNFESVGELNITIIPAKVEIKKEYPYQPDTFYYVVENEAIDFNELVAIAVSEAKSKGADAIVNFEITANYRPTTYTSYSSPLPDDVINYKIKGFCIKRK